MLPSLHTARESGLPQPTRAVIESRDHGELFWVVNGDLAKYEVGFQGDRVWMCIPAQISYGNVIPSIGDAALVEGLWEWICHKWFSNIYLGTVLLIVSFHEL